MQCPIVGDKTYGGADVGSGLFLAALELSFTHPERAPDEPPVHVSTPAPRKFAELLAREHERWVRLAGESGERVALED